jgi:hypothetical protein
MVWSLGYTVQGFKSLGAELRVLGLRVHLQGFRFRA